MTIASRGVISLATAKNQLTAQYLAEESLEVARNIRDENYIRNLNWMNGLQACVNVDCDIDYTSGVSQLTPCGSVDCSGHYLYNNQGVFTPTDTSSGTPTTFWRQLTITNRSPNEVRVSSTVHWKEKTIEHSMTISTYLSNWQ